MIPGVGGLVEPAMRKAATASHQQEGTRHAGSGGRIGMRGRELMGGIGKTMMQSGGTFGTFMAIGMGIRC
ncbi:Reactive oxygen species modulator 1 [Microtus ochrogaster]|uniref:Reactive oxygen species modulator 1 n=1 Tax=Microtus ochrogaster TaxID=79684 RepID=A0A8J6L155_MICOH|nr:Reactive oxygen species modulator 1 [Microtus ochrogaster]